MLSPTLDHVRLFIHVLAACIWVGGQFALAGVVGTLRTEAPGAIKPVAQAFARLAWPAFFLLVVTGLWNLFEVRLADTDSAYQVTVMIKIMMAIASGAFAAIHKLRAPSSGLRSAAPSARSRRWRHSSSACCCTRHERVGPISTATEP